MIQSADHDRESPTSDRSGATEAPPLRYPLSHTPLYHPHHTTWLSDALTLNNDVILDTVSRIEQIERRLIQCNQHSNRSTQLSTPIQSANVSTIAPSSTDVPFASVAPATVNVAGSPQKAGSRPVDKVQYGDNTKESEPVHVSTTGTTGAGATVSYKGTQMPGLHVRVDVNIPSAQNVVENIKHLANKVDVEKRLSNVEQLIISSIVPHAGMENSVSNRNNINRMSFSKMERNREGGGLHHNGTGHTPGRFPISEGYGPTHYHGINVTHSPYRGMERGRETHSPYKESYHLGSPGSSHSSILHALASFIADTKAAREAVRRTNSSSQSFSSSDISTPFRKRNYDVNNSRLNKRHTHHRVTPGYGKDVVSGVQPLDEDNQTSTSTSTSTSTIPPATRDSSQPGAVSTVSPATRDSSQPAAVSTVSPATRDSSQPGVVSTVPPATRDSSQPAAVSAIDMSEVMAKLDRIEHQTSLATHTTVRATFPGIVNDMERKRHHRIQPDKGNDTISSRSQISSNTDSPHITDGSTQFITTSPSPMLFPSQDEGYIRDVASVRSLQAALTSHNAMTAQFLNSAWMRRRVMLDDAMSSIEMNVSSARKEQNNARLPFLNDTLRSDAVSDRTTYDITKPHMTDKDKGLTQSSKEPLSSLVHLGGGDEVGRRLAQVLQEQKILAERMRRQHTHLMDEDLRYQQYMMTREEREAYEDKMKMKADIANEMIKQQEREHQAYARKQLLSQEKRKRDEIKHDEEKQREEIGRSMKTSSVGASVTVLPKDGIRAPSVPRNRDSVSSQFSTSSKSEKYRTLNETEYISSQISQDVNIDSSSEDVDYPVHRKQPMPQSHIQELDTVRFSPLRSPPHPIPYSALPAPHPAAYHLTADASDVSVDTATTDRPDVRDDYEGTRSGPTDPLKKGYSPSDLPVTGEDRHVPTHHSERARQVDDKLTDALRSRRAAKRGLMDKSKPVATEAHAAHNFVSATRGEYTMPQSVKQHPTLKIREQVDGDSYVAGGDSGAVSRFPSSRRSNSATGKMDWIRLCSRNPAFVTPLAPFPNDKRIKRRDELVRCAIQNYFDDTQYLDGSSKPDSAYSKYSSSLSHSTATRKSDNNTSCMVLSPNKEIDIATRAKPRSRTLNSSRQTSNSSGVMSRTGSSKRSAKSVDTSTVRIYGGNKSMSGDINTAKRHKNNTSSTGSDYGLRSQSTSVRTETAPYTPQYQLPTTSSLERAGLKYQVEFIAKRRIEQYREGELPYSAITSPRRSAGLRSPSNKSNNSSIGAGVFSTPLPAFRYPYDEAVLTSRHLSTPPFLTELSAIQHKSELHSVLAALSPDSHRGAVYPNYRVRDAAALMSPLGRSKVGPNTGRRTSTLNLSGSGVCQRKCAHEACEYLGLR